MKSFNYIQQLYSIQYKCLSIYLIYTVSSINQVLRVDFILDRVYYYDMNIIGQYIKKERKAAGLTQEEFALRSGLGVHFVRDLEQGKETVRMDKVNQALAMFGMQAVPGRIDDAEF